MNADIRAQCSIGSLGSQRTPDAAQQLPNRDLDPRHGRPTAAFQTVSEMLRRGPSEETFAAGAKFKASLTYRSRDNAVIDQSSSVAR